MQLKSNYLKIVFFALLFSVAGNVPAQGFLDKVNKAVDKASKKVDKAIEKTDQALGTDKKTQENNPSQPTNQTQGNTSQPVEKQESTQVKKTATSNNSNLTPTTSQTPQVISPHITSKTKIIEVYNAKDVNITDFSDNVCFVRDNKTKNWAIMDTLGNFVTDYKFNFSIYEDVPYFSNNVCVISGSLNGYKNGVVLINTKGEVIKHLPDISKLSNFIDGIATGFLSVLDKKNSTTYKNIYITKIVYLNTKGEIIFPDLSVVVPDRSALKRSFPYKNGLAIYYDYQKNKWGYINSSGKIIIPATYNNVHSFSEGLAAVQNNDGLWGYIDVTGKTKINFSYSNEPTNFSEGIALIKKRSEEHAPYCMIDTTGKIVFQNIVYTTSFYKGKAYIHSKLPNENYVTALIDHGFNILKNFKPDKFSIYDISFGNGFIYSNQYGIHVITEFGDILIDGLDSYFYCGLARCKYTDDRYKIGTYGFINTKGELVFYFKEPAF